MDRRVFALALGLWWPSSAPAPAEPFVLDAAQTEIAFSWEFAGAEHSAEFDRFSGTANVDPDDLGATFVDVVIDPASVNSGIEVLDGILRSERFFAVADHPEIAFVATDVQPLGATRATVLGELTIKGITRPVALAATVTDGAPTAPETATEAGPEMGRRVAIVATTWVLREEWDLGGAIPLASDGVRITISTALTRR